VFGDRLPLAIRYAALLADTGVSHGLVGPREVPRLWDRHLLNCAVVAELLPDGSALADVGSGAGLPGLVLAIARPDLRIALIEPLARRVAWLESAVDELGLDSVTIHRARAEALHGHLAVPVVTARAVARLATLAEWTLPLLAPGGRVLALKGESAERELAEDAATLAGLEVRDPQVCRVGTGVVDPPTTVVVLSAPERPVHRKIRRRVR